MKPGLAVLPLEVWTDVFVYPWITRQQLAKIVDKFKNRKFAEKLQFRLNDMGKQTLHILDISSNPDPNSCKYQLRKRKIPEWRAGLFVPSHHCRINGLEVIIHNCKLAFPETEMPENIKKFKQLTIRHLDDGVLAFLGRIKPLFANVFLNVPSIKSTKNMRILLDHLLPMVASIRGICCDKNVVTFLARHFPGTLELAKELSVEAEAASIPTYLDWLSAPLNFDQYGPRFLITYGKSETIHAIVEAVRKHFLAATTAATFVAFLEFISDEQHHPVNEFNNIENSATNEQLAVRNATLELPETEKHYGHQVHYVEILRHTAGANAKMRDWVKGRAFLEKMYTDNEEMDLTGGAERIIWIKQLTIGRITMKKANAVDQDEDGIGGEEDEVGPSTSTKKMSGL